MKRNNLIIAVVLLLLLNCQAFAWNDTKTHPHITEKAIDTSSFDQHIQNQLKIAGGKEEILNGKTLIEWLEYGAEQEDNPACRASNHFHNPYLAWNAAGLTDTWWLTDLLCWAFSPFPPAEIKSNLTWATGYLNRQNLSQDVTVSNQWDWQSARQYFYTYLTGLDPSGTVVASDAAGRNDYLVKSLQALGQVMHLLQDMAVPAHVRNDAQGLAEYTNANFFSDFDA